ncbi:MAG: HNH endonuclease [Verrucomicrobia bacterium]|nr:MAG: HNH endonuclease [Verrucomicrobiota bacterium]
MNYRLNGGASVILMSLQKNAPYADCVKDEGRTLIYEGHDIPRRAGVRDPKVFDQPMTNLGGSLTQNGKFFEAAKRCQKNKATSDRVKVYEKIRDGIWVFNGVFHLVDAWLKQSNARKVFKFRLELLNGQSGSRVCRKQPDLDHNRMIPSLVKLEVWKRDKGRCVKCGSTDNLHYDHILPFSKGGTSLLAINIQLLCARHNLKKHNRIE